MLIACRVIFLAILEIVMSSVNIVTLAPVQKQAIPKIGRWTMRVHVRNG
jgi:hypothetical protein